MYNYLRIGVLLILGLQTSRKGITPGRDKISDPFWLEGVIYINKPAILYDRL